MSAEHDVPLIYNLFPRLAGAMDRWTAHARRAAAMGFNWLYLNPVQYPGFSGSLYAVKEHYRLNDDFLTPGTAGDGLAQLAETLGEIRGLGLRPMMDLVINHTSKDCPLTKEHPEWYVRDERGELVSPSAIDPADARRRTIWGDLAEIDNHASTDRAALWNYWAQLVRRSVQMGFGGFRCDAAYKVPFGLWRRLVEVAREIDPEVRFFAETLGCRLEEIDALAEAGLDYFFNSSKWWAFDAPWCLEQRAAFGRIAPSISFPESHDTPRLAAETGSNQAVQRGRYAFAAAFSAGVLMPIGYEFGFQKSLDVVRTRPDDWEEPHFDLTDMIGRVNRRKLSAASLRGEGQVEAVTPLDRQTLILRRSGAAGCPGSSEASPQTRRDPLQPSLRPRQHASRSDDPVWILINKSWSEPASILLDEVLSAHALAGRRRCRLWRLTRDDQDSYPSKSVPREVGLGPAEVALLMVRMD